MKTFSLRSLMFLVLIIGLICGWIIDHRRLRRDLERERSRSTMSSADWEQRRKEIRIAAADKENPNVPLLLYALGDNDVVVRETALSALQEIPVTEYVKGMEIHKKEVASEYERWLLTEGKAP